MTRTNLGIDGCWEIHSLGGLGSRITNREQRQPFSLVNRGSTYNSFFKGLISLAPLKSQYFTALLSSIRIGN